MRICEANTRILRATPQPDIDAMPIKLRLPMPRFNASPLPRRIELYAGRGRKEGTAATRGETCIPNGGPGGKRVPESALRLGRSFRMAPQAETTTRNRAVEWDMLSQWQLKRKVHPGILIRNGMQFPNEWLAENSSQNRPSDWDTLSRRQLMLWGWLTATPSSTPKTARSPSQNWVEESQNAIAGGQYDCRR